MDDVFATDFLIRLCQVLFVLLIGAFAGLVTWNNVTDPRSNLLFVQHLMSMDTTFEQSTLRRRAITSPALHKLFFGAIVAVEGLTALLCVMGAAWMAASLGAGVADFHAAKALAFCGLALGFALWFGGFMVIGGQWFASWQSERWNGRESAFMFYTAIGFVFLVLLYRV
jgi:predicted small integral membrane protein